MKYNFYTIMRKAWIGGNFKCNPKLADLDKVLNVYKQLKPSSSAEVVCFAPSAFLSNVVTEVHGSCAVGAQNCSATGYGAYTGEITAEMVRDLGCTWVLAGHSERRSLYGETESCVADKVKAILDAGLRAVVCIGETLDQRNANETLCVLKRQLAPVLPHLTCASKVVIAYEPVWAIGTGVTATVEQAQETIHSLREHLASVIGQDFAREVRIVYGGSVNQRNCTSLSGAEDIDGFLVGGASLKPEFIDIATVFN